MAGKVLLVLGLAGLGLALASGTSHAASGGSTPLPHPDPGGDPNNPPPDVIALIAQATASANPALMRSTADHLDQLGYHAQATALRALAATIEAAQKGQPAPPGAPAVPPSILPVPAPTPSPSGADPLAAKLTAALNLTDPIQSGRTPQNGQNDLVTAFQAQEISRGNLSGKPDGLYGPGVATAVAAYNIVPYPPFYWSANKNKTASMKSTFKKNMLAKAANDPTRADEWSHVATVAQNT